jgi:formate hydrogenlyase subunit 4
MINTVVILLIILISLIFPGIIAKTKAKIVGRKGAPVLQAFYDNIRLLKKGSVYSRTTSFIFQIAPIIYFTTILLCVFFIPMGELKAVFSFDGDFVLFAYLLGLGRFLMILAALDTGSSFEGMGANREAYYSMLAEPAFFIIIASLSLFSGHTSFYNLFMHLHLESNLY